MNVGDADNAVRGVQRSEQLALLRELGCDTVQGYLISRPVPADDLVGVVSWH